MTLLAPKPPILDRLPEGHAVLEASAGTGKTFTLEHLVVDLLLREGSTLTLPETLVVTFTDKATLELKSRVRDKLRELLALEATPDGTDPAHAWVLDAAARTKLTQALATFDQATIATIHTFCQGILQASSFDSGRPFRLTQAPTAEVAERAWRDLLRRELALDPAFQAALEGFTVPRLGDLLKQAVPLEGPILPTGALDLGPLAQLLADPTLLAAAFEARLTSRTVAASRTFLQDLAAGAAGDPVALGTALKQASGSSAMAKHLAETPDGPLADLRAALEAIQAQQPTPEANAIRALRPRLAQAIRDLKAREGLFDFDDMILGVREALAGPGGPALAQRLRGQYRVALIDEFQDTDAAQWEIFRTLFGEAPHRLIVVGDPKQAIYGFRGGDLPTFLQATDFLASQGGRERLDHNFRSTTAMLEAVNRLLDQQAEAPFFPAQGEVAYPHPVACGRPDRRLVDREGKELPPVALLPVRDLTRRRGPIERALAADLAAALQAFFAQGPRLVGKGSDRPLGFGDVFVLVKTSTEGRTAAKALRKAGIPTAFYKQAGLFQTPEAEAFLHLLEALEAPGDRSARARLLLGPFVGVALPDIEAFLDLPEDHPLTLRLSDWALLARQRRWAALFEAVLGAGGALGRTLLQEPGEREVTNLVHLAELLRAEAASRHAGLAELRAALADWVAGRSAPAGGDGSDYQRLERDEGAVQILTMHKSKGLERPVVALFGGLSNPVRTGERLHRFYRKGRPVHWAGSLPQTVKAEVAATREAEDLRLLYVALTRAGARLFLPDYRPDPGMEKPGRAFDADGLPLHLYRPLQLRLRAVAPLAPDAFADADLTPPAAPLVAALPATGPVALPAFPACDHARILAASRPRLATSFTQLSQRRAEAEGDPEPSLGGGGRSGLPGGTAMGTLVHELLEHLDPAQTHGLDPVAWMALPEPARLLEEGMARAALDPRWQGALGRLLWHALITPLLLPTGDTVAVADLDPATLAREMDFLMPWPAGEDLVRGSLDLVFEWEGRLFVLDWKTNDLGTYGPETLRTCVEGHYRLQVQLYTLAILAWAGIHDAAAFEARFGGVVYLFLRGLPEAGVWSERPTWAEVEAWRRDLAAQDPWIWLQGEVTHG